MSAGATKIDLPLRFETLASGAILGVSARSAAFPCVHGGEKTIQWSACVCAGAGGVKVGHWIG